MTGKAAVARINIMLVFLFSLACIFYLGHHFLQVNLVPDGDFAADMLLAQRIETGGLLLTGHYSRYEFNHPGPFFFYALHLGSVGATLLGLSKAAGAYLATFFLNACFVTLCSVMVVRLFSPVVRLIPTLSAVLVIISLSATHLVDVWMPHKLVLPYLAFLLSLVFILRRALQYFPLACLLAAILVHGYISMIAMALPLLFLACVTGLRNPVFKLTRAEKHWFLIGGAIGCAFLLPVIADSIFNTPSNLHKILFQSMNAHFKHTRFQELIDLFSAVVFAQFSIFHFLLLLGGSYVMVSHSATRKMWGEILFGVLLLVLLFLAYHKTVPAPVLDFTVFYFQAVPTLLVTISTVALLMCSESLGISRLGEYALKAGVVVAILVGVMYLKPTKTNSEQNRAITMMASAIEQRLPDVNLIKIDYTQHMQWPFIAGVLYEFARNNVSACTTWQHMRFLYTSEFVCDASQKADVIIKNEAECDAACFFKADGIGAALNHSD